MNDQAIENEIQAKGLTAPRVTPADIDANIASEHYFTAADGLLGSGVSDGVIPAGYKLESPSALHLLTFCVLVLRNGFTVTGESACASPENFDAEIGRKIARANAVEKIWPLMGYALKEKLNHKTTDDFASHVDSWYKNQLNVINHFLDVPEGVRMEVDGVESVLSGDLYKGFIIAMRLVVQDLESHPPFVVLNDEVTH